MSNQNQNVQTFKNPSNYLQHDGEFFVELVPGVDKSYVPSTAEIQGDTVHVTDGYAHQSMGGIDLNSKGEFFRFRYDDMKIIRDGKRNLLWVNYKHR